VRAQLTAQELARPKTVVHRGAEWEISMPRTHYRWGRLVALSDKNDNDYDPVTATVCGVGVYRVLDGGSGEHAPFHVHVRLVKRGALAKTALSNATSHGSTFEAMAFQRDFESVQVYIVGSEYAILVEQERLAREQAAQQQAAQEQRDRDREQREREQREREQREQRERQRQQREADDEWDDEWWDDERQRSHQMEVARAAKRERRRMEVADTTVVDLTADDAAVAVSEDKVPSPDPEGRTGKCVVCWEGKSNIAAVPCGHMAVCEACATSCGFLTRAHRTCFVCREKVVRTLKVFIP
jgi:hypothetical protein